jgi:hypothetical protein
VLCHLRASQQIEAELAREVLGFLKPVYIGFRVRVLGFRVGVSQRGPKLSKTCIAFKTHCNLV